MTSIPIIHHEWDVRTLNTTSAHKDLCLLIEISWDISLWEGNCNKIWESLSLSSVKYWTAFIKGRRQFIHPRSSPVSRPMCEIWKKGLVTLGRFPVCAESVCYVHDYIPYWMHSKFMWHASSCWWWLTWKSLPNSDQRLVMGRLE